MRRKKTARERFIQLFEKRKETRECRLAMAQRAALIWRIFQSIEHDDDGRTLWNLLDQAASDDGIVYMTYGSETPQSLAQRLHRERLVKLIELHRNLAYHRAQF